MASANSRRGDVTCVLRGFNSFLDVRPIVFVDEPPSILVCSVCGEVSSAAYRIPCGHTLCEPCKKLIVSHPSSECCPCDSPTARCPIDGQKFFRREDYFLHRNGLMPLLSLRVRCVNASLGCSFVGKLSVLEYHCRRQCDYLATPGGGSGTRHNLTPTLGACSGRGGGASGVRKDAVAAELAEKVRLSSAEMKQRMGEIFVARGRRSCGPDESNVG